MATYTGILKYGTQAAYEALGAKVDSCLYFCTDTGKLYKGSVDFSNSSVIAASKPAAPVVGKIYILADTKTAEIYDGAAWHVVSYPTATSISAASTDSEVATAKAVYDYVDDAIADMAGASTTIKSVTAHATDAGTVVVTKGDDTTSDVVVPGVAKAPVWDAVARKITFSMTTGSDVVIELGKDIFLDPSADNKYNAATGNIELYLNDGSGADKPATKIEIPAASLVDTYTAEDTDSVDVTVDGYKIKADVKVDADSKNAITVSAAGLMVDLSAYMKTADYADKFTAYDDTIGDSTKGLIKAVADNTSAITTLNGAKTVEGSVDSKIDQAINGASGTDGLSGRVTTLETAVGKAASVDGEGSPVPATGIMLDIENIKTDITNLSTAALEWTTF